MTAVIALGAGVRPPAPTSPRGASGGATTVYDDSRNAFGRALGNLDPARWRRMLEGKRLFVRRWLPAEEGRREGRGLGPLYNADSCAACHFKDGRGRRPGEETAGTPVLLYRLGEARRLSDHALVWRQPPELGGQLQDRGTGVEAEGVVAVSYRSVAGLYPDGAAYSLRQPRYRLRLLRDGGGPEADPPPSLHLSPRLPPSLIGLGLLEAVPEARILAREDPRDLDGDGISGRANWIPAGGGRYLGRFGWKAGQPSLEGQTATAFYEDMGLTSPPMPGKACPTAGEGCERGSEPELSQRQLDLITDYLRLLAPPAQRPASRFQGARGKALFTEIGCTSCHLPTLMTADPAADPAVLPELAGQRIQPFTDLLLHDMGSGLADGVPEHGADGREWRTAPLWGIGLLAKVSGELFLLHDGRARSFEEAILWHGGEGQAARDAFVALPEKDRSAVLDFLDTL